MRAVVIGLGSMGKRRIRNLRANGVTEITGVDVREDRRTEATTRYGIKTYADPVRAIAQHGPDALIVSTPPDLHARFALLGIERGCHVFIEASVLTEEARAVDAAAAASPGLVVAPSCTLRYHPSISRIKTLVSDGAVGKPLLFTYQSGQWLPDWHPWEDYRSFYVSRRATGACREIVPFELAWLVWVFGPIIDVRALRGKVSTLEADIDDVYQIVLRFASGVLGHLLVDVIARTPVRSFRMCSEAATVEWDAAERSVRVFRPGEGWTSFTEPQPTVEPGYVYGEEMYIAEIADFIRACRGERAWQHPLREDREVLTWLERAEASSDGARL